MTKQSREKCALVPRLRFPEFREALEWEEHALDNVANIVMGSSPSSESYNTDSIGLPFMQGNADIKDGFSAPRLFTSQITKECELGDVLLSVRAPVGTVAKSRHHACIGRGLAAIKVRPPNVQEYLYQWLLAFEPQWQKISQGGTFDAVNSNDIRDLCVGVPLESSEQQKIADCLSSIDELISIEARKLDALKTHKKGLMQQLFPAEGETVPKLRFPEFQDAGDWNSSNLGSKVIKVGSGITPNGGDKHYVKAGRPFIRSQNVGWGELLLDDVAYIDEKTHASFVSTELKKSDVLLNITGASIGRSVVADSRVVGGNVNQHVCIIRLRQSEVSPTFLNQYLLSEFGQLQIDSFQAGGNRQGLNFAQVRSFSVPIPPILDEQIRVAGVLSSIDSQIAIVARELDAFITHKKGLMQQLFPAFDEVQV